MSSPIKSVIASGTKLWVDSIDPKLVETNFDLGATGATSNPIIIANLIKTGRFDDELAAIVKRESDPESLAWELTDKLVAWAEKVFLPVFQASGGDDGYVSFELDPLLEDSSCKLTHEERATSYVELARKWHANHPNRMIKVPATPSGIAALERIAASGIPVNVTLIFSKRQYREARDAVWRGAQKSAQLDLFKSAYSIFVSRLDVYTEQQVTNLSPEAQGLVGIVNAKEIWQENCSFWQDHPTKLKQEIIFASTGTKKKDDDPWKYVAAFAGSDIQTNPPETNEAVERSGLTFESQISAMPNDKLIDEIHQKVDWQKLEEVLMREGLDKFSQPQKSLIELLATKIKTLSV